MKIIKIIILLSIMSAPLSFAHEIQLSPLVSHIQYLPPLINFLRVPNEQSKFGGKNSRYFWLVSHYNSEHIQTKECVWHTFGEQAEIWVEKKTQTRGQFQVSQHGFSFVCLMSWKSKEYTRFSRKYTRPFSQKIYGKGTKLNLEIIAILMKRFQSFHK